VVCRSICNIREPCKNVEPIEMPFGIWTRVVVVVYINDTKNGVSREFLSRGSKIYYAFLLKFKHELASHALTGT